MSSVRTLQAWPGGRTLYVSGDAHGPALKVHETYNDEQGRPATPEEVHAVKVSEIAERLQRDEIYCCDSALVTAAFEVANEVGGDWSKEWDYTDKVSNLNADPSDWDLERCKEWLEDEGHDLPDPNPWGMDRAELIRAAHGDDIADELEALEDPDTAEGVELSENAQIVKDASDDVIRAKLIEDIDDETADGLNDWRDAVRENDNGAEVYEWYRVSSWLAKRLDDVGECVLDNAYGEWWGRQCTGQALIMDGVLQKVAEGLLK
jgi:hypothetical protein